MLRAFKADYGRYRKNFSNCRSHFWKRSTIFVSKFYFATAKSRWENLRFTTIILVFLIFPSSYFNVRTLVFSQFLLLATCSLFLISPDIVFHVSCVTSSIYQLTFFSHQTIVNFQLFVGFPGIPLDGCKSSSSNRGATLCSVPFLILISLPIFSHKGKDWGKKMRQSKGNGGNRGGIIFFSIRKKRKKIEKAPVFCCFPISVLDANLSSVSSDGGALEMLINLVRRAHFHWKDFLFLLAPHIEIDGEPPF